MLYEESDIALLAVGSMVSTGEHVREKLKAEGWNCTLANGRFVKPFDKELVDRLVKKHWLLSLTWISHSAKMSAIHLK